MGFVSMRNTLRTPKRLKPAWMLALRLIWSVKLYMFL